MKTCSKCREKKPLSEFNVRHTSRDGHRENCKACQSMENHHYHGLAKKMVLSQYGGQCSCCGETIQAFLSIDHIDGRGGEHRRKEGITTGSPTYSWLKRNNFPEGFQVLCHNCNHGRYINGGICPHQQSYNAPA